MPVVLTNTGTTTWNPARVHLAYHWLWLVPREIVRRSRVLPYQEGIRTVLPAAVPPGAQVGVEGRLLAPSTPGLYWLQWDMVEEGVTWFVQDAPRQPRRLVIVRPTAAMACAPLPLLVALLALVALFGRRAPPGVVASHADLFWCAAVLLAKPFILYRDALLEPTAVAYWLTAAVALLVPAIALALLPRRPRVWLLTAIGLFASVLLVADVLYYRFFGDVLSAPAMLAARQTGRVSETIRSLLSPGLWWLVVDLPFALAIAFRLDRARTPPIARRTRSLVAAGAVLAVALGGAATQAPRLLAHDRLDQMFRNRAVVEQLGAFGFHAYDAWSYARATVLRPRPTAADLDAAVGWFAQRRPLRAGTGPLFGIARGRNLIVVQVESLQEFAVDHVVDGQEVMPHLRRWSAGALRFPAVTDETSEGRTSDAEFTTMVSLLPIEHGAVAFRDAGNHYVGLPRVLAERGYHTVSAVPFEPGFWNRDVMHPAYGFQRSLFEPDFTMTEQIGWGLNDRDFLQQMLPRLDALPRPFCAWLITLSLHHPFADFPAAHKVLRLGALEGTEFGNYLHTMRFFDEALAAFVDGLRARGLLDSSVVVVFGDHDAGFPRSRELAADIGIGADAVSWELADRIPMFVRIPPEGGLDPPHGIRPIPAGQTDLAPTLLALLGIDPVDLPFMGRNLLGSPGDPPVLRPYGDWIDSRHAYFSGAAAGAGATCYDRAAGRFVEARACAGENEEARRAHDVSRLVIAEDLQARARVRLRQGVR